MNWSLEKTVDFIEEYRKHALLWDIRLPEYKNNQAKLDALRGLAVKFNCDDVDMVKKKIKNLRTAFHREHKSLTKKKSGSSSKRGKWFAYDLLLFLLDVDTQRPGYSSQAEPQTEQLACIEYESESDHDAETPEIEMTPNYGASEDKEKVQIVDDNDEGKGENNGKGQKRKLKNIEDERAERAYSILEGSLRRDGCAVYGEHVANEIRKLCPRAQAIAKHLINNVLFEAAMGNYDNISESTRFGLPTAHLSNISSSANLHGDTSECSSTK